MLLDEVTGDFGTGSIKLRRAMSCIANEENPAVAKFVELGAERWVCKGGKRGNLGAEGFLQRKSHFWIDSQQSPPEFDRDAAGMLRKCLVKQRF